MPKLLSARGHGRLGSATKLEGGKIENNTKNATAESSLCCNSLLAASNSRHSLIIRLHLFALLNFIIHSHSPCQRVKKVTTLTRDAIVRACDVAVSKTAGTGNQLANFKQRHTTIAICRRLVIGEKSMMEIKVEMRKNDYSVKTTDRWRSSIGL